MRIILLVLGSVLMAFGVQAKELNKPVNMYRVFPNVSRPYKVSPKYVEKAAKVETLRVTVKMSKSIITKTPDGFKVKFEPLCEKWRDLDVKDLQGGGIISEEVLAVCTSTLKGKNMNVIVSGMVYDNIVADFSDETPDITRNFFNHLHLTGEILTGRGDFNLDNTRELSSNHWAVHLSYDPIFYDADKTREGFVATVRFTRM